MAFAILKTTNKVDTPLLNEAMSGFSFDDRQRYVQKQVMQWVKNTPELGGMLDTLVTDHFMGPVDFFDADGKVLGPTQMRKAKAFWVDNKVQHGAFYGQGMDYFTDGSSFGWYSTGEDAMTPQQLQAVVRLKEVEAKMKAVGVLSSVSTGSIVSDEVEKPRKIWYLAASTTEIMHDDTGVFGYKQDAAGKEVIWKPKNVVHIKLMEANNEVRSFSGFKALVKEVSMMYLLKDNILAQLNNGGSPDNIIGIKGGNGFSKARFNRLRTALESFTHIRKAHGNMPIDAEVQVHKMGTDLKDMEYRELAMFVISEFALATGLPTSRIPFMMTGQGGVSNKGQMTGNTEDAYQKKINNRRMNWENSWNPILIKAGFQFKFRRDNLQDDVRETQASTQRGAYVLSINDGLARIGKQLKLEAHLAILSGKKMDIAVDDVEKVSEDAMPFGNVLNKNDLKNSDMDTKSRVSQDISKAKKETATNNGVSV